MNKKNGILLAEDKLCAPVILEWQKTNILSPDYSATMNGVAEIACQAYTPVELQFLHAHSEAVLQDVHLKQYAPLFENGVKSVDWNMVENNVYLHLQSIFEMDMSRFGADVLKPFINDVLFVVVVKDVAAKALLGSITFFLSHSYAHGDSKVSMFCVKPSERNRGLGKLLMSSIFKIEPDIRRIFLCTRPTNLNALEVYQAWGFVLDLQPIPEANLNMAHWKFMEYKTEQSDILQKLSESFVIQS